MLREFGVEGEFFVAMANEFIKGCISVAFFCLPPLLSLLYTLISGVVVRHQLAGIDGGS
jgi:hypothetical protein